jgi:hypothetical protein
MRKVGKTHRKRCDAGGYCPPYNDAAVAARGMKKSILGAIVSIQPATAGQPTLRAKIDYSSSGRGFAAAPSSVR